MEYIELWAAAETTTTTTSAAGRFKTKGKTYSSAYTQCQKFWKFSVANDVLKENGITKSKLIGRRDAHIPAAAQGSGGGQNKNEDLHT